MPQSGDPSSKYLDAHPPLMTDKDTFPPERSDCEVIFGPLLITGKDMNRITDDKYPWRDFATRSDPVYHQKVRDIIAARDKGVDHYTVVRRRYWEQASPPYHYGTDTTVSISHHRGYVEHTSHSWSETDSLTERMAIDLGIDLSVSGAELPGDVPVPPVGAVTSNGNGGDGPGGGGNIDAHFSTEMQKTLHIMDSDEKTYTDDVTTTTTQTFLGGTTYIHWQKIEEVVVQRVNKGSSDPDPDPVSSVKASTGFDYTDAFRSSSGIS